MRRRGAPRRLRRARYPPAGLRQRGPVADRLHRWLRQSPQGAPAHRRSGGCRGSRGAHIVYTFGDCCGHHQRRLGAGTPSDGAGHCGLRGAVHVPAQQHLLRERHGDAHDGARDRDHRDVYPRRPPRTRGPGTTTRERQRPFSARRGTKGHEGARRGTKAPFTNSGRRPPTAMRTGPRRSRERAAGTLLTSKSARSRRRLPCRAPGCPLAWSSSSSASTARWLDASSTSRRRTWRSWSSVSRIAVLDEACCVTGVALPIDGGYAIKRTPGDNTFHVVQFWIHGLSSSGANSRPCFSIVYRRSRLPSGSSTTINHACTAVMTGECTMFRCVRNSSH